MFVFESRPIGCDGKIEFVKYGNGLVRLRRSVLDQFVAGCTIKTKARVALPQTVAPRTRSAPIVGRRASEDRQRHMGRARATERHGRWCIAHRLAVSNPRACGAAACSTCDGSTSISRTAWCGSRRPRKTKGQEKGKTLPPTILPRPKCQILLRKLAPQAGFEPATLRLTAGCSAVELLRNSGRIRADRSARTRQTETPS